MKTKYPIILVHGIAIKDILFVKTFGRIDANLKKNGFVVYKSNVDGFGTVENNALILKEEINKIMIECGVNKVNIIAHSKGGLDSKYMIQNLGMEEHVASLTTLCTPHKGSPIASNILRLPKWMLKIIAFWINFWFRLFGDKKPDSLEVCKELQVVNDIEDETIMFSDKVYCQSFSTKLDRAKDDFIMGIPLLFFRHFEKNSDSDGLVGEKSTMFGEYKGNAVEGSVSHSEIIDFFANKKKKERIYEFYNAVCVDLINRGF